MMAKRTTKIQWTQRTWNPIVGCSIHSSGCKNCYAMRDAWRLMHNPSPAVGEKFAGTARTVNGRPVWTGRINLHEPALLAPLRRKEPTLYFVNSMSDLFHENLPEETIDRVFAVMALCPQHRFQVLTKRAERMRSYFTRTRPTQMADFRMPELFYHFVSVEAGKLLGRLGALQIPFPEHVRAFAEFTDTIRSIRRSINWPLQNVHLGVSVEDDRAKGRIDELRKTPAAVRFLSCEPLIASLGDIDLRHIHWVICGGESGPGSRPMNPAWARSLRDQCADAEIPFFFKQWGDWFPYGGIDAEGHQNSRDMGERPDAWKAWDPGEGFSVRIGKAQAGRFLDGALHDAMPEAR